MCNCCSEVSSLLSALSFVGLVEPLNITLLIMQTLHAKLYLFVKSTFT